MNRIIIPAVAAVSLLASGCATTPYTYGVKRTEAQKQAYPEMEQQFYQGAPNAFLDASDWYWPLSLLSKLLLWDKDVDSHQISDETIEVLRVYLEENNLNEVQVLVNTYKPGNQWSRLFNNQSVGAGWRYTLGILSVALYSALPGRFFGGDSYNPFTNTINLYSDEPSIALHEGGHAKDFSRLRLKGTHASIYTFVPFAPLYYEAKATNDALGYLKDKQANEARAKAYEITYPAYATYASGSFGRLIFGPDPISILGVIPGHIAGRIQASRTRSQAREEETNADAAPENRDTPAAPKVRPAVE